MASGVDDRTRAGAEQGGSWTAHLLREEDRRVRAERAANAPFAAAARTVRSSVRSSLDVPLEPTFVDRDPREEERWFQELPEAERLRLAEVWRRKRHAFDGEPARRRRSVLEAIAVGAGVFTIVGLLQSIVLGLGHAAWMTVVGAAAGLGWSFRAESRAYCAVIGGLVYFAGCGRLMWEIARGGMGAGIQLAAFFCGLWLCVHLSAVVGMDREARRRGGWR